MKSPLIEILSPLPESAVPLSSSELTACITLARRHGLEMLLYSKLKKHRSSSNVHIDDYLKQNENLFLKNAAISMWQEAAEREVVEALGKQGIPACIIKGNEIARTLYGDPNCRSSSDMDILIKTVDVINADNILAGDGYVREDSLPLPFWIGRLNHAQYRHTKHPYLVELHWDFGFPFLFELTSDDIWNGVVRNDAGGYVLTPEMTMIQLFIHHFKHGFREFKTLVDILWGFHKYDGIINWQEFAGSLKKIGLIKTTGIILAQLDSLWGLRGGPLKSFRILQEQLANTPLHTPAFFIRFFSMNIEKEHETDNARDKIMAKFVLDSWSKVLYSFTKILFPRPTDIRGLYPASRNAMLPVNYLRFICWRVKDRFGFPKQ